MWPYHPELLAKPVPRYTSYPTAVEFHGGVNADEYVRALYDIRSGTPLSLYVHIPYCQSICWYCGCNTGAAGKTQRLTAYLDALESEIALAGRLLSGRGKIRRIAFGGGSPNAITTVEFVRLLDRIITIFDAGTPEISVELDPRGFSKEWASTMAAADVRRVSLGVQTFAPHVQEAIGRVQPLADIEKSVSALRLRGIEAINFDLMYGLPNQSLRDLNETLAQAIHLEPSQISLFGYAHMPEMIPRQRRIDGNSLPNAELRFAQSAMGYEQLTKAGYVAIGFDHFALPTDALAIAAAEGRVHRNFQGFTDDPNDVLLGFGASAISSLPGLLVQNEKNVGRYRSMVSSEKVAAVRGVALNDEAQKRRTIISSLLCQGRVDDDALDMLAEPGILDVFESKGLISQRDGALFITGAGRPYARHIASLFDQFRTAHEAKDTNHPVPVQRAISV
ncbi:oxygen-independent coproporphyrinogen III oxidase [Parasphingorhabdus sp.]|uniref:oxygen-independent coproporphyrinogen III oxidase n=1 Tax=Parasphingorhabdus sp. TaxID=2709688 RepID=UPI003A8D1CDC